jgi:hypothetical protein
MRQEREEKKMKKSSRRIVATGMAFGGLLLIAIASVDISHGESIHWLSDIVASGMITMLAIQMELRKNRSYNHIK